MNTDGHGFSWELGIRGWGFCDSDIRARRVREW